MFYLVDFLRTSGLGCNIPDSSEGLLQRGKEETRIYIYIGVFTTDGVVKTSKDYYLKTRLLKLINLVLFYAWEDAKSLGSLKSFLWCILQLSEASILCFLILNALRLHHLGVCNVMAWWLQHLLFIDIAGDIFIHRAQLGHINGLSKVAQLVSSKVKTRSHVFQLYLLVFLLLGNYL